MSAPCGEKISKYRIEAGDDEALLKLLSRLKAEAERRRGEPAKIVSIHEAGFDGFWVHRLLEANGVESHVVDTVTIEVERRSRRVKTDGSVPSRATYGAARWLSSADQAACMMRNAKRALRRNRRRRRVAETYWL